MGANVELDIFLKKNAFSLRVLFSLLEMKGLQTSIREIIVFDDWYYTNQINIDPKTIDKDLDELVLEKFVRIYFVVNDTWRCTLITSIEDGYLNLSFGLNTDDLIQNGGYHIEGTIAFLYDRATDILIENIKGAQLKELFMVASMGIEYSVHFHPDIMTMLTNDNGVVRWILPKDRGKQFVLKTFTKEEKNDFVIFKRV